MPVTETAPEPSFSAEDLARFAASDALAAAETAWLRAVAAAREASGRDDGDADLAASRAAGAAERAAFLAYMRTPAPDVHSLPGKLLAIERWASELAQDGGDGALLVEALALVRADVIRLG